MARKANVVVKYVRHPGTKAQPYLRPTFERLKQTAPGFIGRYVTQATHEGQWSTVAGLKRIISRALRIQAFLGAQIAGQLAPKQTRNLSRSIHVEGATGGLEFTIGTNVIYAAHVEFGTKPHIIRPKEKKALAFYVKGASRGRRRGRR